VEAVKAPLLSQELSIETPGKTRQLANRLGSLLAPGHCLALCGPLGAGKTLFAKAAVEGMGLSFELLSSPSFAIVHSHESPRGLLFHADFYRLESLDELYMAGVFELDWPHSISFVEWADKFPSALPEAFLLLSFAFVEKEPQKRKLFASAHEEKHAHLLKSWVDFF
jgi:tRNA threonylcarbamoyladenosine biosynthesis protein TsaE